MLQRLEGEEKSQLELILEGYYNFLQRKIIANASDKVGLLLYNVVSVSNKLDCFSIFSSGKLTLLNLKESPRIKHYLPNLHRVKLDISKFKIFL